MRATMEGADPVLPYLQTLAWPAVVVLAIFLFRRNIRSLIHEIQEKIKQSDDVSLKAFQLSANMRTSASSALQQLEPASAGDGGARQTVDPSLLPEVLGRDPR